MAFVVFIVSTVILMINFNSRRCWSLIEVMNNFVKFIVGFRFIKICENRLIIIKTVAIVAEIWMSSKNLPALLFLNEILSDSASKSWTLSTNSAVWLYWSHSALPNWPKLYGTFFKAIPTISMPKRGGNLKSTLQNFVNIQHNPAINLPIEKNENNINKNT